MPFSRLYETTDYRRFVVEALRLRGLQQRDLARAVSRAPSVVSLILSGLRPLDPELVAPITELLRLDPELAAYFAALVDIEGRSPRARQNAWATVRATQRHRAEAGLTRGLAEAMRRWYFGPVLALARCEGFRPDPAWIAGTILPPISVAEAEEALTTAVTLGLLVPDDEGRLVGRDELEWSPSGVAGDLANAAAEAHRVAMGLAVGCLERARHNEREVALFVLPLSDERFARIRARLRELERELMLAATDVGPDKPNRVFQLGIQLFPVTLYADATADHSMFATTQGEPPDIAPDTTE